MEAIILTRKHFDVILDRLDHIKEKLKESDDPARHFLDSKAFNDLMGVSPGTAQSWRDNRKIGYCQVGNKIYYRMKDVEKFFIDHHQDAIGLSIEEVRSA